MTLDAGAGRIVTSTNLTDKWPSIPHLVFFLATGARAFRSVVMVCRRSTYAVSHSASWTGLSSRRLSGGQCSVIVYKKIWTRISAV